MNIELTLREPLTRELEWAELDKNFVNIAAAINQLEEQIGGGVTAEQAKTIAAAEFAKYVGAAPEQLATLDALAEAIGDDPTFAASITRQFGEVNAELAKKVTAKTGFSLMEDREIARLKNVSMPDLSIYQKAEANKGLMSLLEIQRLSAVTNQDISGKANIAVGVFARTTAYFDQDAVQGNTTVPLKGSINIDLFNAGNPSKVGTVVLFIHKNPTTEPSFIFSVNAEKYAGGVAHVINGAYSKTATYNFIYVHYIEAPATPTAKAHILISYNPIV